MAPSLDMFSGSVVHVFPREEGPAVGVEEGEGEEAGLVFLLEDREEARTKRERPRPATKLDLQKLKIPKFRKNSSLFLLHPIRFGKRDGFEMASRPRLVDNFRILKISQF